MIPIPNLYYLNIFSTTPVFTIMEVPGAQLMLLTVVDKATTG